MSSDQLIAGQRSAKFALVLESRTGDSGGQQIELKLSAWRTYL